MIEKGEQVFMKRKSSFGRSVGEMLRCCPEDRSIATSLVYIQRDIVSALRLEDVLVIEKMETTKFL